MRPFLPAPLWVKTGLHCLGQPYGIGPGRRGSAQQGAGIPWVAHLVEDEDKLAGLWGSGAVCISITSSTPCGVWVSLTASITCSATSSTNTPRFCKLVTTAWVRSSSPGSIQAQLYRPAACRRFFTQARPVRPQNCPFPAGFRAALQGAHFFYFGVLNRGNHAPKTSCHTLAKSSVVGRSNTTMRTSSSPLSGWLLK